MTTLRTGTMHRAGITPGRARGGATWGAREQVDCVQGPYPLSYCSGTSVTNLNEKRGIDAEVESLLAASDNHLISVSKRVRKD